MIIFGLGNNEEQYLNTRHNVGRYLVEELARLQGLSWKQTQQVYHTRLESMEMLYGSGYMNTSGLQLHSYLDYKKIQPDVLFIFQDDSDQISGKYKLVKGGGDAGHKGIRDIYKHILNWNISMDNVWRLKVGIRPPDNLQRSETFVLRTLAEQEKDHLKVFAKLLDRYISWFNTASFGKLQNQINGFHNQITVKSPLD